MERIAKTIHRLNVQNVLLFNAGDKKLDFINLLNKRCKIKRTLTKDEVFRKISINHAHSLKKLLAV